MPPMVPTLPTKGLSAFLAWHAMLLVTWACIPINSHFPTLLVVMKCQKSLAHTPQFPVLLDAITLSRTIFLSVHLGSQLKLQLFRKLSLKPPRWPQWPSAVLPGLRSTSTPFLSILHWNILFSCPPIAGNRVFSPAPSLVNTAELNFFPLFFFSFLSNGPYPAPPLCPLPLDLHRKIKGS